MTRKRAAATPKAPRAKKRQRTSAEEEKKEYIVSDKELKELLDEPQNDGLVVLLTEEKARYKGAAHWAPEEERLFEYLFLRQEVAMLPSYWLVDFCGVVMPPSLFKSSEEKPPIIASMSGKEFHASTALMRLIDLTTEVRTLVQSNKRAKIPHIIKRTIQEYITWASKDGGYQDLDYVPNLIVSSVNAHDDADKVVNELQWRMYTLARLQRAFLRIGDNKPLWDKEMRPSPRKTRGQCLVEKFMRESRVKSEDLAAPPSIKMPSKAATDADSDKKPTSTTKTKTPTKTSKQTPKTPSPTPAAPDQQDASHGYRRHPPVVYGLFILRTSVMLLSIDSSKPEPAQVSYHVDINLLEYQQSMWNGITIALAVCFARQDLVKHIADFKPAPVLDDGDPDA
ncbi:hypothetical protein CDD81_5901 [Ophiocordyceps australis]|uniref:Uncharacterized protein n=1 Tax=Ophiocordyceps australis TaxID=1399860 RepID=A0A2C5XC20_9HYPO|nr:hypothetical protein CDD81_5901 [Ophiocordyceps australis]